MFLVYPLLVTFWGTLVANEVNTNLLGQEGSLGGVDHVPLPSYMPRSDSVALN